MSAAEHPGSGSDDWTAPLNAACPHHRGLCAYRADDSTRCPWCHCSWWLILRSGWHTCEQRGIWPGRGRAERVKAAARMRAQAALGLDREARRLSAGTDPTPVEIVAESSTAAVAA